MHIIILVNRLIFATPIIINLHYLGWLVIMLNVPALSCPLNLLIGLR